MKDQRKGSTGSTWDSVKKTRAMAERKTNKGERNREDLSKKPEKVRRTALLQSSA